MKKLLIPILVIIGSCANVFAIDKSNKEKKGDKYYFVYSFDKAIDSYTHTKDLSLEGQRRLAESYHNLQQDKEAEIVYSRIVAAPTGMVPEDCFNYAMILKSNGKYDESNTWMEKFSSLKPEDLRAKSFTANRIVMTNMLNDQGKFKITFMEINTDAQDFAPSFYTNKIVFASSRSKAKMIQRKYNWNGKPFLNMYVADVDNGQLKDASIFNKKLDGKMHDGPASFSNGGTTMAFTRNHYRDKSPDKIVELQICFSKLTDKKWSKPEPFIFNDPNYSVGQPCLTEDGRTMYFTSDMPGGFGGADLYKTTKDEKGVWSKPLNLGNKINTEGDEVFPFFEGTNEMLFFASNGHYGLGGLDVFVCAANGSQFGKVMNAGAPMNSQYDDFALIVDGKTNKGYFSSNRTGGKGDDDIYGVEIMKPFDIGKKIKGVAKDNFALAIPRTFIILSDEKGLNLDTLTTGEDGAYSFLVESDKKFNLVGKKENYSDGKNTASTFGGAYIVIADVILLKKAEIIAEKTNEVVQKEIKIEMKSIYFDLDKSTIREDAKVGLDKIVTIMNKYPNMKVVLSAYTDSRATEGYNQLLSDRREKATADYIKKRITNPERITGKGYGETHLVNSCSGEGDIISSCSEEDHQKNRRTEFTIVENLGVTKR